MRQLFCVFLLVLLCGCITYKHRHFTNCDDGKLTGLDKKVKLDGYYLWIDTAGRNGQPYTQCIFLYSDGTFASAGGFAGKEAAEQYLNTAGDRLYGDFMVEWGRYRLQGDTIIAQNMYQKEALQYAVMETWFAIKSEQRIDMFKTVCFSCQGKDVKARHGVTYFDPQTICSFVPFGNKPDSARAWVRKKRWYSCK